MELWNEADSIARADILLGIHATELGQVKNLETSHDVWQKLETIYQSTGPARKAALFQRLVSHRMGESAVRADMRDFFDTVDRLNEMNIEVNEELLSYLLLISLPESFKGFRCAMQSRDDLPSLEILKIKIREEMDSRKGEIQGSSQSAMVVKSRKQKFHNSQFSAKNSGDVPKRVNKIKCFRCQKLGHKSMECHAGNTKQGPSKGEPLNYLVTTEGDVHRALTVERKDQVVRWCLDSGCTSHMYLSHLRPNHEPIRNFE